MKKLIYVAGMLSAVSGSLWADAGKLQAELQKNAGPNREVVVKDTPIKGLYEVQADGQVFYMDESGRYAIQGNMLDLKTRSNLTESARNEARLAVLADFPKEKMITYPAKRKQVRELWIFDDLSCPYCRKLHKSFPELQENGVTIHVLFFPRSGLGSQSYYDAVKVWCSVDRRQALDEAMASGRVPEEKVCRHPVNEHLALAQKLGVSGTPYMVLDTGEAIPGYVPPKQLLPYLLNKEK